MIRSNYVILDKLTGDILISQLFPKEEVAKREVSLLCNSPNFPYKQYINDLQLWFVNAIEVSTLDTVSTDKHLVCDLKDLVGVVDGKE